MSQPIDRETSDDEFQDAISVNPATQLSNEEAIAEITKKQETLKLADECVQENDEEGAVGNTETIDNSEELDEEAALKEQEKTLSTEELQGRKEDATKLKLEGNELFKADAADKAIELYTNALRICPTTEPKDRAVLYGNRAAAKIKIDAKSDAIEDCTQAIALWPEYVRAILRRAKLHHEADKLDEALEDYKRVYELDPGNVEAREAMVRLPPQIEERNERMKEEMMGKLKDLGNMILKPFGLSTSNFQMQKDPSSGSYSINFNQNKS